MTKRFFLLLCVGFYTAVLCQQGYAEEQKRLITLIAPLSGEMAFIGDGLKKGLLLHPKLSRTFNLLFDDNRGSDKDSVSAFQKAAAVDKASLIVSAAAGSEAVAVLAESRKIPLILTVSSSSQITSGREYVFRYFTNADTDAPVMAEHIVKVIGKKHLAIIYLEGQFGADYANVFQHTLEGLGGKVAGKESFSSADVDYRPQLLRLKSANPDAFYLIGLDYQIVGLLRQAKQLGVNTPFFAVGTVAHKAAIEMGNDVIEGLEVTAFCTDGPQKNFKESFQERYKAPPSFYAELGFDIAEIITSAAQQSKLPLETALKTRVNLQLNAGQVSVTESGEFLIPVCVKRISAGRIFNLATGRYSNY